jgi:mRNA-degrading endonuclease RelE of RelBE toxin-antitoxin system
MKILETAKFVRARKKLVDKGEIEALKTAIVTIEGVPSSGKKLHGEFADLRSFVYAARGQTRRLIYKWNDGEIVLFSFGPRQGVYK